MDGSWAKMKVYVGWRRAIANCPSLAERTPLHLAAVCMCAFWFGEAKLGPRANATPQGLASATCGSSVLSIWLADGSAPSSQDKFAVCNQLKCFFLEREKPASRLAGTRPVSLLSTRAAPLPAYIRIAQSIVRGSRIDAGFLIRTSLSVPSVVMAVAGVEGIFDDLIRYPLAASGAMRRLAGWCCGRILAGLS